MFRRPFCWPRPRIGRGSILFLPDRPIDASRHRYPSVTVRGGLAFSPFARPACLESPFKSLLSSSWILSSGAFARQHFRPHFFPPSQFFHILLLPRLRYSKWNRDKVSIGLLRCLFLTKCSNFGICPKIRLKVFSVRVIEKNQEGRNQITRRKCFFEFFSRKERGKSEIDFQESSLDKLLSLLRRVIFQDRKNRNREDEGIFGGEETWAYRGRNSNDPSNAPADVQTRIVRGIRRPVSQKVSQLYIKTIKREATAGFPPRPRLAQASCPDFMPVDRKFRSLETDPTWCQRVDQKISKIRRRGWWCISKRRKWNEISRTRRVVSTDGATRSRFRELQTFRWSEIFWGRLYFSEITLWKSCSEFLYTRIEHWRFRLFVISILVL